MKEGGAVKEVEKVLKCNRFAILATESEIHQGFVSPGECESRKSA